MTTIKNWTFAGNNLREVVLPASVVSVERGSFRANRLETAPTDYKGETVETRLSLPSQNSSAVPTAYRANSTDKDPSLLGSLFKGLFATYAQESN